MNFLFKVAILFLIVFNFRLPYIYNSVFLSIVICAVYYIFKKNTLPFTYFFQRYNAVILIGTLVLAFVVFIFAFFHGTEIASTKEKRIWVMLLMLLALVFALPLLIEEKKSRAFDEIAIIICYAFAIQGLISFIAYLYPPFGNFLFEMKPVSMVEDDSGPVDNIFRFYNLSGIFFVELTAAFGVAFIVFFWLMLKSSDHPYLSGWKKYMVFIFIFMGTVFSGRTGFIGFVMGFSGWIFFSYRKLFAVIRRNGAYIIAFFIFVLFTYGVVLSESQRQSFNDEVFPFAFEWYYNYMDYGKFEVGSAEGTRTHYYHLRDETLLKGHGVDAFMNQIGYPHSDAGYTNTLVFGGIPLLLVLIIYQCLYFARPMAVALKGNSRDHRICLGFFLLMLVYIFIVEIKAPAIGYMHLIQVMYIALGSVYMIQYYYQREQVNLTG